jgi:5-methyltetrahydrofolate--homocysteine methyltransferase
VEKKERQFVAAHDDYSAILLKALADHLAEPFAEGLHQHVRTEFWGYAPDEALSTEGLIAEKYSGSAPPPATPPALTTASRRRCSRCSKRKESAWA